MAQEKDSNFSSLLHTSFKIETLPSWALIIKTRLNYKPEITLIWEIVQLLRIEHLLLQSEHKALQVYKELSLNDEIVKKWEYIFELAVDIDSMVCSKN